MAQDFASRASMDMREMRSRDAGADGRRMGNTFFESNRKTAGEKAIEKYAAENPAINPEKTHLNWDFVNDGEGSFRESASIEEMVAYAQSRRGKLLKAVKGAETEDPLVGAGERYAVTAVYHLPWYMLEEDGTTYYPLDRNGKPKDGQDGRPLVELPRYQIKPGMEDEARRYVDECLQFTAKTLPGGQASIIGGSFNVDESRPHVQFVADTLYSTPTKKRPEALSNGYSRVFGRHRDDLKNPAFSVEKNGKRVSIGARGKMELYHQQLKTHMVAQGFHIQAERDALRHDRRIGDKADYAQMRDDQRALDEHATAELIEVDAERQRSTFDVELALADAAAEAVEARVYARAEIAEVVATARSQKERADAELASVMQMLEEARAEAHVIETGAQTQAQEIVAGAEARATEIKLSAETEAQRIRDEADTEADARLAAAQDKVDAAVSCAVAEWEREEKPRLVEAAKTEGFDVGVAAGKKTVDRERRRVASAADQWEKLGQHYRAELQKLRDGQPTKAGDVPAVWHKAGEAKVVPVLPDGNPMQKPDGSLAVIPANTVIEARLDRARQELVAQGRAVDQVVADRGRSLKEQLDTEGRRELRTGEVARQLGKTRHDGDLGK